MSETRKDLPRDEQTEQSVSAIRMLNRLSVAEIRLTRANRLSNDFGKEMQKIRHELHSLSDSLLLGEDVSSNLNIIDGRLRHFEQRITT